MYSLQRNNIYLPKEKLNIITQNFVDFFTFLFERYVREISIQICCGETLDHE